MTGGHMKKTVLVVEDQEMNREILKALLEDRYTVIGAENGLEALEILKTDSERISAILLDIVMPVMDGYGFLEEFKKEPEYNKIPVIVTTDKDADETEEKALALGANDFVNKPYNIKVLLRRIDNLIDMKESIYRLRDAERDSLTGAYNRKAFYRKAKEIIKSNPEEKYQIIASDIEKFKYFNDAFGWKEGDSLLKFYTEMLNGIFENKDVVFARAHSDIFYFLSKESDNIINTLIYATKMVYQRFYEAKISFKFGVYNIEDKSIIINSMCDNAIAACNQAKLTYDHDVYIYDDALMSKNQQNIQITKTMKQSLMNEDFKVYYQPKYDIQTNKMIGAEALIRWQHPELGFISPGEFIPIFEENGFITELDIYIWEHVCGFIEKMKNEHNKILPVSVNVSRKDIYKEGLPEILKSMVERHNLSPTYLHLEITESAYMENTENILEVVRRLKEYGFIIEMDDFGSGYSSLNILAELPIDIIKLDMKFIQNEQKNKNSHNIISSIVNLAKWMNLIIVVEGAETEEHIQYLRRLKCNFVQGYYFSRPIPEQEFKNKLLSEDIIPIFNLKSYKEYKKLSIDDQNGEAEVIVLVDELQRNREMFRNYLDTEYRFVEFDNEEEAYQFIKKNYYNIILTVVDTNINEEDKFHLLHEMKKNDKLDEIPVLYTTGDNENLYRDIAIKNGADGMLFKPYDKYELNNTVERLFEEHRKKVIQKLRVVEGQVKLDTMTGLLNRKEFERQVRIFLGTSGKEAIFLMIDIDNFKGVNDSLGHIMGDQAIINVAKVLDNAFSEEDLACRFGGDEFAIFIKHGMTMDELKGAMEELRSKLRINAGEMKISCSIGVALFPSNATEYKELYRCADMALIQAKKLGKNQFQIYTGNEEMSMPIDVRNMGWLIEESHEIIFICNEKTKELLYMNRAAKEELTYDKTKELIGLKCHETIWDSNAPCEHCDKFCNELIKEVDVKNEDTGKTYNIRIRKVPWNSGYALIHFAEDITKKIQDDNIINGMLDNIRFGLEEEKYIYWHVSMDTNICDLGTKTKETFNVEADNVDYIEFIKGNVIVNEDVDKFIEFYKQTKLQKTNKKIQINCFDKDGKVRKALLSHIVLYTPTEKNNGVIGLLNYID